MTSLMWLGEGVGGGVGSGEEGGRGMVVGGPKSQFTRMRQKFHKSFGS